MRIVIATPFYPPETGVLATYAAGLEGAFRELGHDVAIVKGLGGVPLVSHFRYYLRMRRALRGASFVLTLDTWSVGIPAQWAARAKRIPLGARIGGDFLWEQYIERTGEKVRLSDFYSFHRVLSPRERMIRWLLSRFVSNASHIFFNTRFQKEIWERAYAFDPKKTSVLENYYPQKAKPLDIEPTSRKIFVSANRGARYKQADTLARVFERVREKHGDIELDTRILPHKEQLVRLTSCYAAIVPSLSEIGSNIAIEAVSYGRPFITTEDTGTKERLSECGIFVDTRSPEALEKGIESLLDPAVYARVSEAAKAFTFSRSWNDIAREILAVMERGL